MKRISLGILSPSNIALNRFLPALKKSDKFNFSAIAVANDAEKRAVIKNLDIKSIKIRERVTLEKVSLNAYDSFEALLNNQDIDAVYIPLPPALHYHWAKKALQCGKHILLEKPSTTSSHDTLELIDIAKKNNLAVFENYMFEYHSQLSYIKEKILNGYLGEVRHYKMSFGFPMRSADDFRYNKALGGGALLDCGGYPIKLANILLGDSAKVKYSNLNYTEKFDVDVFGTVLMGNEDGISASISFGMDNAYQCSLEVWGSIKTLTAKRIFTAGDNINPTIVFSSPDGEEVITLERDDQFLNAIDHFYSCITNTDIKNKEYQDISNQMGIVQKVIDSEVTI